MKDFNMKKHTEKYMEFAKAASRGLLPNKKAATTGSLIGLGLGGILICAGIYGLTQSTAFGVGSLAAGVAAAVSNAITLKRIKSK